MIIDHRTYTLKTGSVPQYFAAYEKEGLAIQTAILGNLIGYFTTETGPLNQVIHMWGYADFADREQRRRTLAADPGWQAYFPKVRDLILTQETKIITPAPFSPIK